MRSRGWPVLLLCTGLLTLQTAWLIALPPFRGSDEADHAYRAAGAAHGQWRLTDDAPDGSGQLVSVPEDLEEAAAAQCISRPQIDPDNCEGVPEPGGRRLVTTTAGSYNPVYYWVIGTAGAVADGSASLYAMRIASALLCLVALLAGGLCLSAARAGPAVWLGAVVGITPTFLYSTVVAAPNGIEMAAGFALWASLTSIGRLGAAERTGPAPGPPGWLLWIAGASAVVLVTPRALGPFWVLLILATVVVFQGLRATVTVLRSRRRTAVAVAAVVLVAAVASVLWTVHSGLAASATAEASGDSSGVVGKDHGLYGRIPVHSWVVQAIAAFPYRDQIPNPVIHQCVALVLVAMAGMAVRRGTGSRRVGLVLALVASLAAPLLLVLVTEGSSAAEWQGRYALPYLVGIPLLAGWIVQDSRWRSRFGAVPMTAAALAAVGLAQTWSVAWVQHSEMGRAVSRDDSSWVHGPIALTAALAVVGSVLSALAVLASRRSAAPPATLAEAT